MELNTLENNYAVSHCKIPMTVNCSVDIKNVGGIALTAPYGTVIVTHARANGTPAGHGEDGPIFNEPDTIETSYDGENAAVAVRHEHLSVLRSED